MHMMLYSSFSASNTRGVTIVLVVITAMGLQTMEKGICSLLHETVVGFLKLVKLFKGLVVHP
jgi:hypothetical protein